MALKKPEKYRIQRLGDGYCVTVTWGLMDTERIQSRGLMLWHTQNAARDAVREHASRFDVANPIILT